jgi:hypothetical protein
VPRVTRALVAVHLSLFGLGCAHPASSRARASDEREVKIAAYRHLLLAPGTPGQLLVNCLSDSSHGVYADAAPEVLEAFRSAPELVAAESACRSNNPAQLPLRYRGEVLEQARRINVVYLELGEPGSARVAVWITGCPPGRNSCLGAGYSLELRREGGTWVVVKVDLGGIS